MESSSNGCEELFLECILEKKCFCVSARRFCFEETRIESMQANQILIWHEASTMILV
jgi:hypothetical protein